MNLVKGFLSKSLSYVTFSTICVHRACKSGGYKSKDYAKDLSKGLGAVCDSPKAFEDLWAAHREPRCGGPSLSHFQPAPSSAIT